MASKFVLKQSSPLFYFPLLICMSTWWLKFASDFCESKFTESWDREWDFSRKFLRVENENETSQGNFWGLRMRMRVLMIKLRVEIENETLNFSRMRTIIWESRLRMRLSNFREWEPLFESRDWEWDSQFFEIENHYLRV